MTEIHTHNGAIIQRGTGKPRMVSLFDLRVIEEAENSNLKVRMELAGDRSK